VGISHFQTAVKIKVKSRKIVHEKPQNRLRLGLRPECAAERILKVDRYVMQLKLNPAWWFTLLDHHL